MSERTESYATALTEVARTEGQLDGVADELYQVARLMESNDELRTTLSDASIPASRRLGVVDDLLGSAASPVTANLVSMLVGAGRANDLPGIADGVRQKAAEARGRSLAEVRSAVPLTDDQRSRLAEALSRATDKNVDVQVVVDPELGGGIVAQVDDEIFDGSVATRLERLRSRF